MKQTTCIFILENVLKNICKMLAMLFKATTDKDNARDAVCD